MEVFYLLLFTVPVFYILGLYQLISWFSGKSKVAITESREQTVKRILQELKSFKEKTPQMTVEELFQTYNQELLPSTTIASPDPRPQEESRREESKFLDQNVETVWSRWYAMNSINLLLYVGAFFIVASASIFVSFQWESISGVMKASMLTLCSFFFFGFGAWFFTLPKIKNAGATFLAIGSLLIPIVGSGWYTFVFQTSTSSPGMIWLLMSGIALIVYGVLAHVLQNKLYSYLMTISSLSIVLSLINMSHQESSFYVLGGIITSFLLLVASYATRKLSNSSQKLFAEPAMISSQLIMPTSLLIGFSIGARSDTLFSLQGSMSIFLAAVYYLSLYFQKNEAWKLAVVQILLIGGLVVYGNWKEYSAVSLCYSLGALALLYLSIPYFYKDRELESNVGCSIGFCLLLLLLLYGVFTSIPPLDLVILSFLPVIGSVLIRVISKNIQFSVVASAFAALTLYLIHTKELFAPLQSAQNLAIVYVLVGVITYAIIIGFRRKNPSIQTMVATTILYLSLSVIFSLSVPAFLCFTTLVCSFTLFSAAYRFEKHELLYVGVLLFCWSLHTLMGIVHIGIAWYPIAFTVLAYMLFLISLYRHTPMKNQLRNASLGVSIFSPLLFGLYGYQLSEHNSIEQNALNTAYAGLVLVGAQLATARTRNLGYLLSALALGTYLWQIQFIGIEEMLAYTVPIGCYFLGLGWYVQIRQRLNSPLPLTYIGLVFLLWPSCAGVFGDDQIKHTILLLLTGGVLLALGISYSQKLYKRAGIGALMYAVLIQTYDYIFQLPRWLLVGILGIGLISIAMFLLLRRKDEQSK